jgi:transcriptional regulator with XRE-family HTH domain
LSDSNGNDFHSTSPDTGRDSAGPAGAGALAGKMRAGASLRAAREAQGLSVKDIAARTRITARHVEALEAGDYGTLPGRPYALGFARSYAKAVGLDEIAMAETVRAELGARGPAPEPRVIHQFEAGDPAKTPTRLVSWLAGLLVLAVIGLGLVFWRSYYWPSAELPALVSPEEPKPAVAASQPVAAPSAAPAPAPVPGAGGVHRASGPHLGQVLRWRGQAAGPEASGQGRDLDGACRRGRSQAVDGPP